MNTLDNIVIAETSCEPQLDLFTWDRMKSSQGFSALERLDFAAAKTTFEAIIARYPDHREATSGSSLILDWRDAIETADALNTSEAVVFLLQKIKEYDFGPTGSCLCTGLNSYLTSRMALDNCLFIPPDIYLGDLYLEAGEYGKAEGAFSKYLENDPCNGALIISMGNSLWMQGKTDGARHVYARAFLISPMDANPDNLKDDKLKNAVHTIGSVDAPIYGWLEGILPLIEIGIAKPQNEEHEKALAVYSCINFAEKARTNGRHAEMIEARRHLKKLSVDIFEAYMERVSGNRQS